MDDNQIHSYFDSQNPYADTQNIPGENPYAGTQSDPGENPYADKGQYTCSVPRMEGSAGRYSAVQGEDPGRQAYVTMQNGSTKGGMIGFAVTGLVCGILSIFSCCMPFAGVVIAAVGLAFGIIALVRKYDGKGMALAGVICSSYGLLMSLFMTVLFILDA